MRRHSCIRAGILVQAPAVALLAGPVGVQAAEEDVHAAVLQEVTVTAQRRVENLQAVPIAATVLTGDMLQDKGVQGITALQYVAPSLTVSDYGSANVLNIRGIGRSAVDIELPSGVVLYRDGVPTFPGYFQNEPYYDIASVEVLRGPQGTFVGKSAAGGAIFIRTAAPDLTGFSGKIEAEVGNYDSYGGTLVLNAPVNDQLGFRLAARHIERNEAYVHSLTGDYTGRPGRPDLSSVRLGMLWQPLDSLSSDLRVDLSDLNFGGNLTSSYGYPLYDLVQRADFAYRDRSVRVVENIKYTLPNGLQLNSQTGYQTTHTRNNLDRNGNAPRYYVFDSAGEFTLYSQEIDLVSSDDGPFSYVLGAFAQRTDSQFDDWRHKGFNFYGEAGDLGGLVQGSDFPYLGLEVPYRKREDEISGFVDVKYRFTSKLTAELGGRFSNYKLSHRTNLVLGDGTSPPVIPFYAGSQHLSENDVDAKLSVSYEVMPDQNVYVLGSRGHVTSGFNVVGGAYFGKELVNDYEAGWKATWAQNRVRTQLGGYYQTLSNYQAQFASELLPGANILQNAQGDSHIYGFEASMQARLGQFNFDASLATLHSRLGSYPRVVNPFIPGPDNIVSISGGKSPFAPTFSLNVGGSYTILLSDSITLAPRLDYGYISEQSGSLIVAPNTHLPARGLLNGGVRLQYAKAYADIYGTNLTNKHYVAGIQNSGDNWYPGPLRQYGLRLGYDF